MNGRFLQQKRNSYEMVMSEILNDIIDDDN